MRKERELVARAARDFELAKRYKQLQEYMTATLLYTKAVEKMLRALFINKKRREPPVNASIRYLAREIGVPDEVSMYIACVEQKDTTADPAEITELTESTYVNGAEAKAYYMDGLVKRLLDYINSYAKI